MKACDALAGPHPSAGTYFPGFGSYEPRHLIARDLGHHRQSWLVPRATMSNVESRLVERGLGSNGGNRAKMFN